MTTAGKCTNSENKCLVNTYCPATGTDAVDCITCEDGKISTGQGCNCAVDKPTVNCALCTADKCSKCIDGNFLSSDSKCTICDENCATCNSGAKQCTSCKQGFLLDITNNTCQTKCSELTDCSGRGMGYCDLSVKHCKPCATNCQVCASAEFCAACGATGDDTVLTIEGKCTKQCNDLPPNKYCLNGVATDCADDATSECTCSNQQGCATCNTAQTGCGTCLKTFAVNAQGKCTDCAEGRVHLAGQCIKHTTSESSNKLGSGAIVGIVIGALVIVGVVGGGLAYYFIRKARK
ncbi:Cysteine-rich membrane protein 1 [Spironucleus salmonicida]|uniref:Cysteine-rich membrane protein 1 n=1 Tax=Spironucleus salmonicida TaxID=348837 RepID=V6LTG2_9EUKA|nr:Cysteine-rich membrane protein 1 [Spironucleus salmonicida]|eukprot:EST47543.1 Cysteine-rich membrane protein 1 [Spironucleus salmonicida]